MTFRYSNTQFLTVLPPVPLDNVGWEVVSLDVGVTGSLTVMQRVYNFTALSGSKMNNDIGAGSVTTAKDDVVWTDPLPAPLTAVNPLDREFLWQMYEDGILRHEFWGEDIQESIATENEAPILTTVSGRSVEGCLEWGLHVPAWSEVQEVTLSDDATANYFRLAYLEEPTGVIPHDATEEEFHTVLIAATGFADEDLEVTKVVADGVRTWSIRFVGQFLQGNATPPEGFAIFDSIVIDALFESLEPSISSIDQVDFYNDPDPQTAAKVFIDALERCQARGILQFINPLFDAVVDSYGEPWVDNDIHEISPGETLFSLLERFSEAYGWGFRMLSNFRLQVSQDGLGLDRSLESRFWLGKHQLLHTLNRTSRDLRTRTWSQSDENFIAVANEASPATELGREAWVDGFSGGAGYAQVVANTTQSQRQRQLAQRLVRPPHDAPDTPRLFVDYTYDDWVAVEDDLNEMHRVKISGIVWTLVAGNPVDVELVFYGE
jgi:hypothetical protein